MKKKLLIIVLLLIAFISFGCKKEESKTKEKSSKEKVVDFVKSKLPIAWEYSEDKLKVNDDYSVEVIYNRGSDWFLCAYYTSDVVVGMNDGKQDILKDISKITFTCKTGDTIIGKAEYQNLTKINKDNVSDYAKYYKGNDLVTNLKEEFIKESSSYNYQELIKNPNKYRNKKIKINGEVIKVSEEKIGDTSQVKVLTNITKNSDSSYQDTVQIVIEKEKYNKKLKEKDIIEVYGIILTPVSYYNNSKIPSIHGIYFS